VLLLAVLPMRDLWAPDEPDFAQCVKEMRLRGEWLLPYLNGQPYSEKPILYYWVMKASAQILDTLTGGLGFSQGVAAWALRLPSVRASVAFLSAFRIWAAPFPEPSLTAPADWRLSPGPLGVGRKSQAPLCGPPLQTTRQGGPKEVSPPRPARPRSPAPLRCGGL